MFNFFNKKIILRSILVLGFLVNAFTTNVSQAYAFYNDDETSNLNNLSAGLFDFVITENADNFLLGKHDGGNIESFSFTVAPVVSSMAPNYNAAVVLVGSTNFCSAIQATATNNAVALYTGNLSGLTIINSVSGLPWTIDISLSPSATNIAHGDTCTVALTIIGTELSHPGWIDEEEIEFTITANMIVMNEVLPNPTGIDSDPAPAGEWVELYNNGSTAVDLVGWKIVNSLNDFWVASVANMQGGTTTIAPGGFQVIYRNGALMELSNTGIETIRLRDNNDELKDELSFDSTVKAEGLSWARIPDGVGAWVDPIPTPGQPNIGDAIVMQAPAAVISETLAPISEPEIVVENIETTSQLPDIILVVEDTPPEEVLAPEVLQASETETENNLSESSLFSEELVNETAEVVNTIQSIDL